MPNLSKYSKQSSRYWIKERQVKISATAYERFVRILKIGLPVFVVLLLVLIFLQSSLRDIAPLQTPSNPESSKDVVLNPRFRSIDTKQRPFFLTATHAKQTSENKIFFGHPKGSITLEDGAIINISSQEGDLSRIKNDLQLSGGVKLTSDQGFNLNTSSVYIDLKKKTAESSCFIKGKGRVGEIEATDGFNLLPDGTIRFLGKTKLVIHPSQLEKKAD
jgi:lipopolysaccharide export system protein LptC